MPRVKNWSQLDCVTRLRSVVELSISSVDSIVAVIVEDNYVARSGIFWRDNDADSGLGGHTVAKLNAELSKDEHHIS